MQRGDLNAALEHKKCWPHHGDSKAKKKWVDTAGQIDYHLDWDLLLGHMTLTPTTTDLRTLHTGLSQLKVSDGISQTGRDIRSILRPLLLPKFFLETSSLRE